MSCSRAGMPEVAGKLAIYRFVISGLSYTCIPVTILDVRIGFDAADRAQPIGRRRIQCSSDLIVKTFTSSRS